MSEPLTITFDRPAYTPAEWAKACGLGITTINEHIKAGDLVPSYPNSKKIITLEEGLRWLRTLPNEEPLRVAS